MRERRMQARISITVLTVIALTEPAPACFGVWKVTLMQAGSWRAPSTRWRGLDSCHHDTLMC